MSNHAGGYMLNHVLHLLEEKHVFEVLGKKKTAEVIKKILEIAPWEWDCNNGEILGNGIGRRLGVCHYCREEHEPADFDDGDDHDGICKICEARPEFSQGASG